MNLKEGKDCITTVPTDRWTIADIYPEGIQPLTNEYQAYGGFLDGVDQFDPLFFGIAPRQAELMDPQIRLFMETVWETVEDAGYTPESLRQSCAEEVGIFVGVMYGEYQLYSGYDDEGKLAQGQLSYGSIAHQVSYVMDFHGPSLAIDTMCSSSLTAIHLAVASLQRGECSAAIAGGVNLSIHPNKFITQALLGMSSSDGRCRSFGEGGDGFVPSEGVGAILLRPLSVAETEQDNIYGVIIGSSINAGGKTNGYTVPSPIAQAELMSKALRQAQVDATDISYIEAHGTGTQLGDPIEISGLQRAFEQTTSSIEQLRSYRQYCAIGSVKSNIGHCESAAGIAGVTKVLLQLKHQCLVPSLHSKSLNTKINFAATPFKVQQRLTDWQTSDYANRSTKVAAVLSFGAGGANAAVIIEEYLAAEQSAQPFGLASSATNKTQINAQQGLQQESQKNAKSNPYAFILSAKSVAQLAQQAQRLIHFIKQPHNKVTDSTLASIAYTLQTGRVALTERAAFIAADVNQLLRQLNLLVTELTDEVTSHNLATGIYRGRCDAETTPPIVDARAFELNDLMINDRENSYADLLAAWVQGAEINWCLLYGDEIPAKISLPTYPFARQGYWIPKNHQKNHQTNNQTASQLSADSLSSNESAELYAFTEHWRLSSLNKEKKTTKNTGIARTTICIVKDEATKRQLELSIQDTVDTLQSTERVIFITDANGDKNK